MGTLDEYEHKNALAQIVQDTIRPIYEDLTADDLLEWCEGGFTQNNNESVNSVIWSMAPKTNSSGANIVQIATYIATSTFNDGYKSILPMMNVLNLTVRDRSYSYCTTVDDERCATADTGAQNGSKEARIARRDSQKRVQTLNQLPKKSSMVQGSLIEDVP
ncbi:uncharacterized protein LOC124178624 [Neodiprion fabricii]|uniref:uncharacterized protein LOC124178624 n=1 Tax=Neodiprion fabricii TaxID=2872261 RepID=UPI001ED9759B|nr:uncharacterized protein LOC124178624 [Neodiprion fabricii]